MAMRLQTIVCLVDFSDLSMQGLTLGVHLARQFSAALLAFHAVHQPSDQIDGSDYPQSRPHYAERLMQARCQMDRLIDSAGNGAIPLVVGGEPVDRLVRLVEKQRIDLVVAPSRGISAFRRLFTGTLVERLVRRVSCPVLICRPKAQGACEPTVKRMVAGIPATDRDGPGPVMTMAVRVAGAFDADLHLVHVCLSPPDTEQEPYSLAQAHLDQQICRQLQAAAGIAGAHHPKTRAVVLTGTPAEAIGTYAAGLRADLVVVGVRQAGTVARTLIGSTTEALLRGGPCCLLTLPANTV
jgi:nucleotide-binding universal stress UspA family protein